jgi:hypothetical protein
VQLAPALTVIAKSISDTILPAMRSFGDMIRDFILVGIMRLIQLWNRLKFAAVAAFEGVRSAWSTVINGMRRLFADFLESVADKVSSIPGLGDATRAHLENIAAGFKLQAAVAERANKRTGDSVEQARQEMIRNNRTIEEVTNQQIRNGAVTDRTSAKVEEQTKALQGQAKAANDTAKATQEAAKQQDALGKAFDMVEDQFKDLEKAEAKRIAGLNETAKPKQNQTGPGALQGFASAAGSRALGGNVMQLLTKPGRLANGMQMLGATAGNAASSLASMVMQTEPVQKAMESLMRAIRPIVQLLGRMLAPVIRAVTSALRPVLSALVPVVRSLKPIFEVLAATVNDLSPLLKIVGNLLEALAPAIRVAATVFAAMLNPIQGVKKAFNLLKSPMGAVKSAFETLADLPGKVFTWLKEAFTGLVDKIWNAIKDIFGNLNPFGGGGGGFVDKAKDAVFGSIGGGSLGSVASSVGSSLGFANGGVIRNGNVVPFANGGVLNQPTPFPMSGGRIGVAGEAGPEAAFAPLTKVGGKLAVTLDGAGPLNELPSVNRAGFQHLAQVLREEVRALRDEIASMRDDVSTETAVA